MDISSWFSWAYQKAVAGLAVLGFQSSPSLNDYWTYAEEAYMRNPYVHAAIKLTARSVADIPARLYRVRQTEAVENALKNHPRLHDGNRNRVKRQAVHQMLEQRKEKYRQQTDVDAVARHFAKKELIREDVIEPVDSHELYEVLRKPNEYTQTSFQEFMISLVSYLEIGGMVFVEPNRGSGATDTTLNTLTVRQPRDVELKRGEGKPITHVKLTDAEGDEFTFKYNPDPTETDIFYDRYFHPQYPRYGLSPVEAAAMSVDVNNEARRWNHNLLQNGAQPSGVLSTSNQLGDRRRQRLKREWREKHAGPSNAGSVIVADGGGGAEFTETSMSPHDMQWSSLTELTAREVSVVWNVPAGLIGHTESNTYNNYQNRRRSLYVEKVIPLVSKLYGFLNSTVVAHYDEPLLLDYETASVDALKKEINDMHERMRQDVQKTLLTPNEARSRIGQPEVDGGDVLLVPKNMVPLEATNSASVDDATLEPLDVSGNAKGEEFEFDPVDDMDFFKNRNGQAKSS